MTDLDRRALLLAGLGLALGQTDPAASRPSRPETPRQGRRRTKTPLTPRMFRWRETDAGLGDGSGRQDGAQRIAAESAAAAAARSGKLAPETRARAADGVVAYTAICTHNGCDVDDWLAADQLLSCPCHYSIVRSEGRRQSGRRSRAAGFAGAAAENRRRETRRREAVHRARRVRERVR